MLHDLVISAIVTLIVLLPMLYAAWYDRRDERLTLG
jgi:hypothetical protein